jgi:hypothetical protein
MSKWCSLKTRAVAIAATVGIGATCAACAPALPPGVLPSNDVVPAGQGAPPALNKYLVPYTSMVIANEMWTKQPVPSVAIYAPKGCDTATTDYAQLSDVPEAYEVLIGCPTSADINVLYSQVNWVALGTAGWKAVSGYGNFGSASRAFVQFYYYPNLSPEGCWTYMDLFKSQKVLGITGYCDELDDAPLASIKVSAEQWTAAVLHQIALQVPAKTVTI